MGQRLKRRIEELLYLRGEAERVVPRTVNLLRFFFYIGRQLLRDRCLQRAAALAYVTLITLIPLTALFFLLFSALGGLNQLRQEVQGLLLQHLLADSMHQVTTYFDQLTRNLTGRALGIIGGVAVVLASYALLRTVDETINEIWQSAKRRSFLQRMAALWALLTLVPLLIGSSLYLSAHLGRIKLLTSWHDVGPAIKSFYAVAPFLFTFLALYLFNRVVPTAAVRRRAAVAGAFVSALFFEGAKALFNAYVIHVLHGNKIYGSLGLLPIFLLWIYLLWLIILFGTEVTYTLQNLKGIHAQALKERIERQALPVDVNRLALEILFFLTRRFLEGRPPALESEMMDHLGSQAAHASPVLACLEKSGLVAVQTGEEERTYLVTRDLTELTPAQVLLLYHSQKAGGELALTQSYYEDWAAWRSRTLGHYLERG